MPDRTTDLADGSTYCHACGGSVVEATPVKALILNKTSDQKVYVRRSVTHVCFKGKTYGVPSNSTAVSSAQQVTVSRTVVESLDAVVVSQTLPQGSVVEVWTPVSF